MEKNLFVKSMIVLSILIFGWLFMPFLKSFIVALLLVVVFMPIHISIEDRFKKLNGILKEKASFFCSNNYEFNTF